MHQITLVEVGDEVGLPLPDAVIERLRLRVGDTVHVRALGNSIELTADDPGQPAPDAAGSPPSG